MISKLNISIPKPCNENWNNMTPKDKGRFCSTCSKTVIDFTKKTPNAIEKYLIEHKNKKICGHFYKNQLDTIVLEIPEINFNQQLSFQKLFILALLFVMGTTLFSCKYSNGRKQKIENIIIRDTLTIIEDEKNPIVSIKNNDTICKTTHKIDNLKVSNDSIEIIEVVEAIGEIIIVESDIEHEIEEEEITFGFIQIEESPRFKEAEKLNSIDARKDFNERINELVKENFNLSTTINLGLRKGKHRIFTQFEIDKKGYIKNLKIRAPHPFLKKEIEKLINKLPQFIPGKQNGKNVKSEYFLPISFKID